MLSTQTNAEQASRNHQWQLAKSSDGIVIKFRQLTNSPLIEIKAETTIRSTLSGFLLFLQDTQHTPQWLDNAVESQIIEVLSPTSSILKTKFSGFLFFNSRVMIIKNTYWQNKDLSIEIESVNAVDQHLAKSKDVLVDVKSAHWLITPVASNKIKLRYQFIVDAKGDIPHWLVNRMALRSTLKTLKNLQQQLPVSAWQQHTLDNINELH